MNQQKLVLVADDDEAMRELISTSLQRQGFATDECADGAAVLERLRACGTGQPLPDVLVSDVQMPGATGLDVLHWVRRCLPDLPVVLITAFGDARTHHRASALGAELVIDKPFDLKLLEDSIAAILASRESGSPLS